RESLRPMNSRNSQLRPATDADWYVFFGSAAPGEWFGLVADAGHMLLGIGGLFLAVDGRWWATVAKAPGVRSRLLMHKAAREVMNVAREAKVPVHALADPAIPRSAVWLERLGFQETDEMRKNHRVWAWTP